MLSLLALVWLASAPVPGESQPTPPAPRPPPPQCVSSQGRTVCGYQCKTSSSHAACARTPYGVCQLLAGNIHCWDPPRVAIAHPDKSGTKPECKEIRGKMACGYNCRVANGEVACNGTPHGVCTTHFERLVCWDPPESVIHEQGADTPKPRCLTASEAVGCGYDCRSTRTEVRCASTPTGVCQLDHEQLTCFDPPSLLHCDHSAPPPPAP
ncbi:hypothetical protein F0U62_13045 [Cystobacter fuscus]|nr:hypothetical protein F0U62_13045 [Cystobacter fuscus]